METFERRLLLFVLVVLMTSIVTICTAVRADTTRPVVRNPAVCPAGEIAVVGFSEPLTLLPNDVLDVSGGDIDNVLLSLEWIYVDDAGRLVGEWQSNMLAPCLVEARDA